MRFDLRKCASIYGLLYLTACGMQPSGGSEKKSGSESGGSGLEAMIGDEAAGGAKQPAADGQSGGGTESSDATVAGPLSEEARLAATPGHAAFPELATSGVRACHDKGQLYIRRVGECAGDIRLATSFACDEEGIRAGFAATGYQIDEVVEAALTPTDSGGGGFVIDQCGESVDGHLFVHLVRQEPDGSFRVREIETIISAD